jgi:hypothetical protein
LLKFLSWDSFIAKELCKRPVKTIPKVCLSSIHQDFYKFDFLFVFLFFGKIAEVK